MRKQVDSGKWTMDIRTVAGAIGVAAVLVGAASALAAPPAYVGAGSYQLPSGSSVFDAAADGRLICVTESGVIVRQSAINGGAYTPLGSLPAGTVPGFGPGFLHISPNGAQLAVGDNGTANHLFVVPTASLSTGGPTTPQTINVPNFDGAWTDNTTMYINGSPDFSTPPSLFRVNITTGVSTPAVSNIGNGSGGVAARSGRVFTAIGYDAAGLLDGQVRSFDLATLGGAVSPVAFSTGLLATQASTGNSLAFDTGGNLIEAGFGGVSVIDLSTSHIYNLPGLSPTGFYAASYNAFTSEILVRDFGSATVLRFGVPAPAGAALLGFAGIFAARRRRA